MRKVSKIIGIICLIIIVVVTIFTLNKKDKKIYQEKQIKEENKFLTLMIEKEAGTGKYEESNSTFAKEGYYFNEKLSKCENGSKIKYNEKDKTVDVYTTKADKCFAYFDYDKLGSICRGENISECFTKNYKKDDTIVYHDGNIIINNQVQDAEDFSYRYSGASNIVNNFVCFDEVTNEGKCKNDDNLYRIIGLFKKEDGKYETKLIKNNSIGQKVWNDTEETVEGHYANEWKYSTLNAELNGTYYDSLSNSLKKMIVKHSWYHGGCNQWTTAKKTREYEMGITNYSKTYPVSTEITTDYIGLMYASDYGFGVDSQYYDMPIGRGASSAVKEYNWLFSWVSNEKNDWTEWTITRTPDFNNRAWFSSSAGSLNGSNVKNIVTELRDVRPCFYLSSNVKAISGEGTYENPYHISL